MSDAPATPVTHPLGAGQDPSALTTQALQREVAQFRDLFEARLKGAIGEIEARLDAMDKALGVMQEYPTELEKAVAQLKELHEAKFSSATAMLGERDKLRDQWQQANTAAIDKAFQAAKELLSEQRASSDRAITKSEISTKERLDQLSELFRSNIANIDKGLGELGRRMDKSEGGAEGAIKLWGIAVAAIMVIGVIVGVVLAFMPRAP